MINLSVAEITVGPPPAPADVAVDSVPTSRVAPPRVLQLMDIDPAPSHKAATAIDASVANLIGDLSLSAQSTQRSAKTLDQAGSRDDRRLVPDDTLAVKVRSADIVVSGSAVDSDDISNGNSTSCTQSTHLANRPSAASTSSKTAESTSPSKGGSGAVMCSASLKKTSFKRGFKQAKKSEMLGRRSTAIPSPVRKKIKFSVLETADAMGGSDTRPTSAVAPDISSNDNGALTILPCSSSDQAGASS